VSDVRVFLTLWQAAHRAERLVARELEAAGVDGTQLALLLLVGELGRATATEVAAELGVPFMTASDALRRLEHAGDVARFPNPEDRRSSVFSLTATGKQRVRAVAKPLRRAAAALEAASPQPVDELHAVIEDLDNAISDALDITIP
jgi:MarR family transcriptional regulator for hemolysin